MLDPIFSRHGEVPQTPTNVEREQAWRNSFNPHRQDEAAAPRGALADGAFSTEAAAPLRIAVVNILGQQPSPPPTCAISRSRAGRPPKPRHLHPHAGRLTGPA